MRLRFSAPVDQNGLDGDELVRGGEHPDGRSTATQCRAQALAIAVIEPEVPVVELSQQRASGGPHAEADGPQKTEDGTGRCPLAATRRADLMGLELAALAEHKDADRVVD